MESILIMNGVAGIWCNIVFEELTGAGSANLSFMRNP